MRAILPLAVLALLAVPVAAADVCVNGSEVSLDVGSPYVCPRTGGLCPGYLWNEETFEVTTPRVCVP